MIYGTNSWFHENGSFSLHSFNEHYLSIPHNTGSWENRFLETQGTLLNKARTPMRLKNRAQAIIRFIPVHLFRALNKQKHETIYARTKEETLETN